MNITVFGANGRIGQKVTALLASQGHTVRAFVHNDTSKHISGVTYIVGDIYDEQDVKRALQSAEAVVSCLGSWGTPNKDILEQGMKHIIPGMRSSGISRIVSLTGADAWTEVERPSNLQKMVHAIFGTIAGKILRDGEAHIALLERSGLEWTVLRSPVMNDKGLNKYHLSNVYPKPWLTIHRDAVATALCDQLTTNEFHHQAPYLHRR